MVRFLGSVLSVCAALLGCGVCHARHNGARSHEYIGQAVRLVGTNGAPGSAGLLQIRTGNTLAVEFGTVCGMNLAAADVVCAQLGYEFGSVSTSPCGIYGGANLCGSPGSRVAMSSLTCEGGELDIQECTFSLPDSTCLEHAHDSIVYCGVDVRAGVFQESAARLLSFDGSPSIDGAGRLEIFHAGAWGPVCKSGFTIGAANVACKAMGFSGTQSSGGVSACGDYGGKNYCGSLAPQLGEVSCSGQEAGLLACPFEDLADVFCAPEESVLLRCAGDGDTQGRL